MEKRIEAIIEFCAQVLYIVITKHVSHDRAFQEVLHSPKAKATKYVPLKTLYRVSRAIVSDYYLLRYAEEKIYGSRGSTRRMVRLWLVLRSDSDELLEIQEGVERLKRKLSKTMPRRVESIDELIDRIDDPVKQLAIKYSFPEWFVEKMLKFIGDAREVRELLQALNEEKWWIRVNTLKTDVDEVRAKLEEKGVFVKKDHDLPYMLKVVDYSIPLHHLEEMWKGEIVFQDKASAMVVEALEPSPEDVVLDMTAAPGIKASLIMQLTDNRARIVLLDVSWERLKRTKKLLRLYGVDMSRVELIQTDSRTWWSLLRPTKVLLDAPCTSTGTMGKDPAVKIHLEDPTWVEKFPQLQRELLIKAITQDAERVVYATCSLLPEEGEEHLEAMQDRIELIEPQIPGSNGYKVFRIRDRVRRFFPHIHDTQGFFIAVLRSKH